MRYRQQGMTFIGLLFIIALVAIPVYAGIRLVPVYLNYMKVARSMESITSEFKGTPDEGGIRRALEKHWQIDDVSSVDVKDVDIKKNNGVVTMHVAYEDKVPYIADISLVVSFEKTVMVE
jgi:hypothetical protein